MKILFLTDGLYPFVTGGMQKFAYYQAKYLARSGVSLEVVHVTDSGSFPGYVKEEFYSAQELLQLNFKFIPFPAPGRFPGHYIRNSYKFSNTIYQTYRHSLKDFDLVLSHGLTGWRFAEARRKNEIKVPLIVNLHGLEMFQAPTNIKGRLSQFMLKKPARINLRGADGVCTFGGKITEVLQDEKVAAGKLIPVANGVDDSWIRDRITRNPLPRKFLFTGRYERRKGIEELQTAIAGFKGKAEFHFIGPIPAEKQLKDPRITYHGEIKDGTQVRALMRSCDALICPSYSEGMPTVILEAMASGLAVIATDVGAVSRMISANGVLLPSPEVPLIAQAIAEFAAMPEDKLMIMRQRSLDLSKSFSWENVTGDFLGKIKKFVKIRGGYK